jgi:hypothetical protein
MEGPVMRKLLSLILVLGLTNPIAPVWARDGDKSLAGKATGDSNNTSKKEREAELLAEYERVKELYAASRATMTEENPFGDVDKYIEAEAGQANFENEEALAIENKEVRKSYEPHYGQF